MSDDDPEGPAKRPDVSLDDKPAKPVAADEPKAGPVLAVIPGGSGEHAAPTDPAVLAIYDLLDRGDFKGAADALFDLYSDSLYAFCARTLRDRQAAEDVTQQVFLEASRDLERFQRRSALKTWLLKIAAHRCQDALRSRRGKLATALVHDEEVSDAVADRAPGPFELVAHKQELTALDDCLDQLSSEVCMTVMLRFQTDMTFEDMSPILEVKADTLNRRVQRAMPVLRECLESKGITGE